MRTYSDTGMALKKIKLLESLRLGTNYNLIADSLTGPLSIDGRTTILDRAQITFNGSLNPYKLTMRTTGITTVSSRMSMASSSN